MRDGAEVKTSFSTTQGDSFIPSPVHITGSGPDGSGAIFSKNSGMGDKCFANGGITGEIVAVKGFEATEHLNLWKAYRDGNSIRLHYAHGMAILIK